VYARSRYRSSPSTVAVASISVEGAGVSGDNIQSAIERLLEDGPGYGEQILADGGVAVALDGDLIVEVRSGGERRVIGGLSRRPVRQQDETDV
jgi:hypothetical protein